MFISKLYNSLKRLINLKLKFVLLETKKELMEKLY